LAGSVAMAKIRSPYPPRFYPAMPELNESSGLAHTASAGNPQQTFFLAHPETHKVRGGALSTGPTQDTERTSQGRILESIMSASSSSVQVVSSDATSRLASAPEKPGTVYVPQQISSLRKHLLTLLVARNSCTSSTSHGQCQIGTNI
jgi:hypothetical protein